MSSHVTVTISLAALFNRIARYSLRSRSAALTWAATPNNHEYLSGDWQFAQLFVSRRSISRHLIDLGLQPRQHLRVLRQQIQRPRQRTLDGFRAGDEKGGELIKDLLYRSVIGYVSYRPRTRLA
jgi:hypothetical protein